MAFEYSRSMQLLIPSNVADRGGLTGFQIDSAFIFETSGDYVGTRFVSPVSQTSGTLSVYAYVTADNGQANTDFNVQVRNGPTASGDSDRPEAGGSTIGTMGTAIDLNGVGAGWATFSDITALTLAVNSVYYAIVENKAVTPGTEHATICRRGAMDGNYGSSGFAHVLCRLVYNTNGFAADPNLGFISPVIVEFDGGHASGEVIGNPYIDTVSLTSSTNYRGNQLKFDTDVIVSGVWFEDAGSAYASGTVGIYDTSGNELGLSETSINYVQRNEKVAVRFTPFTISAGTVVNVVAKPGSSDPGAAIYTMGSGTIPAAVKACGVPNAGFVNASTTAGLTATLNTEQLSPLGLIVDNFPTVAGGGGSASVLGQVGLKGGMQ